MLCFSGGALVTEHTTCEVTRDCEESFLVLARILRFTVFPDFLSQDALFSSQHGDVTSFSHAIC